jgi:hypothetical protein
VVFPNKLSFKKAKRIKKDNVLNIFKINLKEIYFGNVFDLLSEI